MEIDKKRLKEIIKGTNWKFEEDSLFKQLRLNWKTEHSTGDYNLTIGEVSFYPNNFTKDRLSLFINNYGNLGHITFSDAKIYAKEIVDFYDSLERIIKQLNIKDD